MTYFFSLLVCSFSRKDANDAPPNGRCFWCVDLDDLRGKVFLEINFLIILRKMEHYLLKEEAYELIGHCMEVHTTLGTGFSEAVYKDALEYELRQNRIPFGREVEYRVRYKDIILPHYYYFADFVVFDQIILEAKAVSELKNEHIEQTINYLAVSGMELGLLVNFRKPRLEYKRLILTERNKTIGI